MIKQIHKIIAEQAEVGIDYIKPAQRLKEDLELDSLDIIELSIEVENILDNALDDEFNIKVTEDEYSDWVTVKDVVNSYWSKVKQQGGIE